MTEQTNPPSAEDVVDEGNETVAPEEAHLVENTEELTEAAEEGPDEGDVAADYLEELLDIADLDGDLEIEIRGDRTFISIQAEEGSAELDDLVGPKGEVLDALQELTRLAVLTATGNRTRLVLDINGHRAQRHDELQKLAAEAVEEARDTGEPVHLEPMSAYERKIVHDYVAEAGLVSESEGEGKRRHVVVSAS
ncbi:protein jag [Nesterenkonia alba]|uniref:Jag family protein n=1 Tax=Nesterenkonia alba TaxID=515814 RepID=UPI0003B6A220|nr:R3H domain-containing nucleic acid-binding protein [Nesterenkonia alba]